MSGPRLALEKADEKFTANIVKVINTLPLVIVPGVDKYSGAPTMMIGVVQDEKVCPIGRIMNVEEIEYGVEFFVEANQLVQGNKIAGLELWYENRFVKPSRPGVKDPGSSEQAFDGEHPQA